MTATSSQRPSLILLGAASGLSPFGMTLVVPTLAGVAQYFSADYSVVQFLVSAYLFGLATAQPVTGSLCDRLGRRPVMLGGFAIFVVASLACALADDLYLLILLRFCQALGVSVGTVASRAIIRDTHGPRSASQALSFITAAMGVAPVVGPMIGGWIGQATGYKGVFVASAIMGIAVWCWMYASLTETRNTDEHGATPGSRWWTNYGALFRSRMFMGYALIYGFVSGTFFSFIAIGADVFERHLGIDQASFGIMWGFMAIAHIAGASMGGYGIARFGPERVLRAGVILTLLAGVVILLANLWVGVTMTGVLLPLLTLNFTSGIVTPGSLAAAVSYRPDIAGTASGLSSSVGIVVGGVFTIISGNIYDGRFTPVAALIALAAAMTFVAWLMTQGKEKQETGP